MEPAGGLSQEWASRAPASAPRRNTVSGLPPHQSLRSTTSCTIGVTSTLRSSAPGLSHAPTSQFSRAVVRRRAPMSLSEARQRIGGEAPIASAEISSVAAESSAPAAVNTSSAERIVAPGGTCTFLKRTAAVCVAGAASTASGSGRQRISSRGRAPGCAAVRTRRTLSAALA